MQFLYLSALRYLIGDLDRFRGKRKALTVVVRVSCRAVEIDFNSVVIADENSLPIFPVLLEGISLNETYRYLLTNVQFYHIQNITALIAPIKQLCYNEDSNEVKTKPLFNLASALGESGDCAKSLELFKKAFELHCKALGKKHANTLAVLDNLACAYGDIESYSKAMELHKKVYKLRCMVLGKRHPSTLASLHNLACA